MGLEAATYISQLVATNPTTSDNVSQGDDHVRLMKAVLQAQFPNLGAAAVTATAAELNIIDGVTATTAELNYSSGVTSAIQTQLNAKVALTTAGRWAQLGSTVTASASSSVDFVNGSGGVVIDSTYDLYMVEIVDALPATGAVQLWMKSSTNAGSSYGSNYTHQRISAQTDAATTVTAAGGTGASGIILSDDQGNAGVSEAFNGQVLIWKPSSANPCYVQWFGSYSDATGAGTLVTVSGAGLTPNEDVDAIRFLFSSGNIASGTFRLFGRVK